MWAAVVPRDVAASALGWSQPGFGVVPNPERVPTQLWWVLACVLGPSSRGECRSAVEDGQQRCCMAQGGPPTGGTGWGGPGSHFAGYRGSCPWGMGRRCSGGCCCLGRNEVVWSTSEPSRLRADVGAGEGKMLCPHWAHCSGGGPQPGGSSGGREIGNPHPKKGCTTPSNPWAQHHSPSTPTPVRCT